MGRFDIEEVVQDIKRMMQLIGTWPEESPSMKYKFIGFLTMSIKSVVIITMLIQVLNSFADLQSLSLGICTSLTMFHSIVKHLIVSYNKPTFFKILNSLKDPVLALHEDHLDFYLKKIVRLCKLCRLAFFSCSVGTGLILIISPIFDTKSERPLPVPFPLVFDDQPLPLYYFVWCFQSVGIILTCCNIPSLDGLLFTFIAIAAGQLRILQEKIVHAVHCSSSEPQLSQIRRKQIIATNNLLKKCVRQHTAIERYIAAIENTFRVEFLIQLIISLVVTCFIGFNFILLPVSSLDFGRCLLFFAAALLQLIFFCVPANEIILQSHKIRDACYMSEWTDCDPSIRKTLFIIMERSKRPFKLTAASFTQLSLETFVTVLKSAFSYFTVLMQLYANTRND